MKIEEIVAALTDANGLTPEDVLQGFLPKVPTELQKRLVPLTEGHRFFLMKANHPLGGEVKSWDNTIHLPLAIYAFTRPAREAMRALQDGSLMGSVFAVLDDLPFTELETAPEVIIYHWMRSRAMARTAAAAV